MKLVERLVLSLYSLLIAMASVIIVIVTVLGWMGILAFDTIVEQAKFLLSYQWTPIIIVAAFLVLFLVSIKLAFGGIGGRREREPVIKASSGGEIAITLDTFESIAVSTLKKIPEAKDYTARVRKQNEGIIVSINLTVVQDANIPAIGESIQTKVTEDIEGMTGVKVLNVRVKVDNISAGFKNKLE